MNKSDTKDDEKTKECIRCHTRKTISEFLPRSRVCNFCHRPDRRRFNAVYRAKYREKLNAKQRAYNAAHLDERKRYNAEYHKRNKEKHNAQARKYHQEHKEQIKGYKRDPVKARKAKKAWVKANPERDNASHRRYYLKNKERIDRVRLNNYLKVKYGVTLLEFEAMSESQNGVCAICKNTCSSNPRLSVDHCHRTGQIRGLLCSKCNSLLGSANDDIEILASASSYLRRFVK